MRKRRLVCGVLLSLLLANLVVGYRVHSAIEKDTGEDKGYRVIRQFASVLKLVRKNYVDQTRVDYEELVYGALQGMLTSLDRFSSFIKPEEYDEMLEETEGEFGGIGIVISIKDDFLTVVAPMEDTPGMRAGLIANDRIIKVGDEETSTLSLAQAVNLIKGEPGTTVDITIYRPSTDETRTMTIERAIIEIVTVKDTAMIEEGIGYVRVTQFNEKTSSALGDALDQLSDKGLKALVLDLRGNPGGLLSSSIEVCSIFVPRRQLIVFTEGRDETSRHEYMSKPGTKYLDCPVAILINEGSASASEIVAGALQDYGRALVVGEKSFGKGSVQSIIELDDGSALRLTTAKYYTPSERVIHDHGIEPDFIVDISDEDSQRLAFQRSRLAGTDEESDAGNDIEDEQLRRATELLKGVMVMSEGEKRDFARIIKSSEQQSPADGKKPNPSAPASDPPNVDDRGN